MCSSRLLGEPSTCIGWSRPRALSTVILEESREAANNIVGEASIDNDRADSEGRKSPVNVSRVGRDGWRLATAAMELIAAGSAAGGGSRLISMAVPPSACARA